MDSELAALLVVMCICVTIIACKLIDLFKGEPREYIRLEEVDPNGD